MFLSSRVISLTIVKTTSYSFIVSSKKVNPKEVLDQQTVMTVVKTHYTVKQVFSIITFYNWNLFMFSTEMKYTQEKLSPRE